MPDATHFTTCQRTNTQLSDLTRNASGACSIRVTTSRRFWRRRSDGHATKPTDIEGTSAAHNSAFTPDVRERLNPSPLVGSLAAGAAVIGAAFATEKWLNWQGVSTETMVSIGSILLLAGVLFLLERRFIRRVGVAVRQETARAVDERIEAATEGTRSRLQHLQEQVDELVAKQHERQDASVKALELPSFRTVAGALAIANELGAISHGHVIVQGSSAFDELGLDFSWGRHMGTGRFSIPPGDRLRVKAEVYADERAVGARPLIEVEWTPNKSAEDVGMELREQLTSRGRWNGTGTLRWQRALTNLQSALDIAIRSRRRDAASGLLQGAMRQFVSDWAITDAGIEHPARGVVLAQEEFPTHLDLMRRRGERRGEDAWNPQPPEGVDEKLWRFLVHRARRWLPREYRPPAAMPAWVPQTKGPRELGIIGDDITPSGRSGS